MARKNAYGRYILSAGEISTYVLCPEAWRLSVLDRVDTIKTEAVDKGNRLHNEWEENLQDAMYFTNSLRLIVALGIIAIFIFALRYLL